MAPVLCCALHECDGSPCFGHMQACVGVLFQRHVGTTYWQYVAVLRFEGGVSTMVSR